LRETHRDGRDALEDGRTCAAGAPVLLRWVHLRLPDAFLHAQLLVRGNTRPQSVAAWPDAYVAQRPCRAAALGATDLSGCALGLNEANRALAPELSAVRKRLRTYLVSCPG